MSYPATLLGMALRKPTKRDLWIAFAMAYLVGCAVSVVCWILGAAEHGLGIAIFFSCLMGGVLNAWGISIPQYPVRATLMIVAMTGSADVLSSAISLMLARA